MLDSLKREYPSVSDVITALKIAIAHKTSDEELDLDELIYDVISEWDQFFKYDDNWYSEEDTDIKDAIRDQVLEFLGE
jgi:hypothetical protein